MTDASDAMKRILIELKPQFKDEGFRKNGSTFNRSLPDGITHVVNFQMSHDPEPRSDDIPGRTFPVHGKFTVNLGIAVTGIKNYLGWEPQVRKNGFISEFHCQIRQRISSILPVKNDKWWVLTNGHERHEKDVVNELQAGLTGNGFPWFVPCSTQEGLITALQPGSRYLHADLASSLLARVYVACGDLPEAQETYTMWVRSMVAHLRLRTPLKEEEIRNRLATDAKNLGLTISDADFDHRA